MHGSDGGGGDGGVIEFGAVIPTSATGFIEINYSLRPHTYRSEIAAILARRRPGQQPQQPEERAGGQTKEESRTGADAIARVVVLRLINFKVIIHH